MTKTRIKSIVVMAVLTLSMLIAGSFIDLDLSNTLYRGDGSLIAIFGGMVGKLPAFLLLAFSFAVLMNYVRCNANAYNKWVRILLYIAYSVVILLSFLLAFYSAFEEITDKAKYIAVVLSGVAAVITISYVCRHDFDHIEELKKWALLTIMAVVITMIVVLFLKEVWGRYRYLSVIGEGDPYTPWYHPNGPHGGHSFPSGHTALWGTLFMLIPLMSIYNIKGEGLLLAGIIFTNLLIGVFRIIGGHHYLTDVAVSMMIVFVVSVLVMYFGYKNDRYTLGEKNIFRKI